MTRALIRFGIVTATLGLLGTVALSQENKPPTTQPAKTPKAESKVGTTAENLGTAFVGESNANARYKAFAKKADEEGYGQVASLFRAAARAEEIHAQALGELIKKGGGTPKAEIATPDVKSTKENLAAALAGESYERDTMYPGFLERAKADKNTDAVKVFNHARSAETEHAKFYQEALGQMDSWKTGKKDFYVCSVCGYTVTKLTFEKCPICFTPKDKYEKIN